MTKSLLTLFLILLNHFLIHAQGDVLWKFETNNRIYSTPIIHGDMIFVGSGDHYFYALDKKTGEEVWKFKTEGAIHSSPSILNGVVYFGSADGNLYAVNETEGTMIWKLKSEGEKMYGLWDYYLSSPAVNGKTVYWACGDGNLYAVHSGTGKIKWTFKTNDIIHASPVIYKEHVYVGGFDGNMYCINKENGVLKWKFKTVGATYFPKGEIQKAALVEDDIVYFGSRDYNIYALDANTGTGHWNMKQPNGWIIATPTSYKGNLYFGTSDAHLFYCMDKNYGVTKWTIPVSMRVYGTALAHNDIIYFGTFDGKVLGIDYLTGKIKWEFQTEKSKENYGTMYNEKGEFKEGFELYGNGFEASEAKIHDLGSILSSPVIDEQIIYFGSSDGHLYAVKLK